MAMAETVKAKDIEDLSSLGNRQVAAVTVV